MNTGDKIDYMIQCLQVARAEYEYNAEYVKNEPVDPKEYCAYYSTHRTPNKSLIKNNLRNVARMGFQAANEVK